MAAAHARRLATGDGPPATPAVGPASGGRSQFNLSSGAATAVVFVSIVLCFILLCTYCRCARQRAIAGARSRVMRELRERVPGVLLLRPTAGAALPVLPYSAAAGAKKGPLVEDCPVCLEAFADDDGVKVVPACGHVFHTACIDQWLAVRNSCPVCRCAVVCYYADRARDTAVVVDEDDQEVVLERVVAMIEAIREEQREEEVAAAAVRRAVAGGIDDVMMTHAFLGCAGAANFTRFARMKNSHIICTSTGSGTTRSAVDRSRDAQCQEGPADNSRRHGHH